MPPVGFQPAISVGERPQTHALERAATGTGHSRVLHDKDIGTDISVLSHGIISVSPGYPSRCADYETG
jgi:hypothetical protein